MTGDLALWEPVLRADFFEELEQGVASGARGLCLTGLVEGARSLVLTLVAARTGRGCLVVAPDDAAVEGYRRDLSACAVLLGLDPRRIVTLPALDADPYDGIAAHPEVVNERVVTLSAVLSGDVDFLLIPARATLNVLPPRDAWRELTRVVRRGDELPPDRFVLRAIGLGYRRVDVVANPGEVSRRGGVVDVFPPTRNEPVRIELFGDTVDSLRSFDTDNQRSTGLLESIEVGPAMESPPTDEAVKRVTRFLNGRIREAGDDQRARRQMREQLDQLQNQGFWPGFEALAGLTATDPVLAFNHARNLTLVVDEPESTDHELLRADRDLRASYEESGNRTLPPPSRLFGDPAAVRRELAGAALTLQELAGDEPPQTRRAIHVACRGASAYAGRFGDLARDLRAARSERTRVVCAMRTEGSADRVMEILGEYDLPAARGVAVGSGPGNRLPDGGLFVRTAALRNGFEFPGLALRVLAERDLFGEERLAADRKGTGRAAFVSDFHDLKAGDLLVHVDHGVARYTGLGRPKGGSLNRDFLVLAFAGGDKLFVPVDRLDLVQKFTGVAEERAALDRLGGPGWEKVKTRVRKAVESMARELLELYARRRAARGHAFSPDTPWQRELEQAFPYELTPHQRQAMDEIKSDMESDGPMDRLLVGDVGYGKTEVAVRAAFKAVMDGYQVAILSPTTVLAAQHLETLRERFAPFPVKVEMVSRFRSAGEVRDSLNGLADGSVDVLIGTHRLLSRDVRFRRLGLLVVDEEQRFGVRHKERLQKLSVGVDVLSMTATPIPRTLQMSMAGVRDLSIIETPPPGRQAIKTHLVPFRKNVVAQAIRQELRRGGQVFVVHNRIETLPSITRAIGAMVPDARIVMAHGRLREHRLEEVMLKFVRHEADVLVTTTIIENGLDIPRANTIIVNRADRFGLAQLYQLRGRVGRSLVHAYAYFVVPTRHNLSDEARKRLRALQEFSDLGAGFRLAAADLEIRGAGELLGSRQHGHIAALGFDLYCQMLERAVQEQRGEPVVEREPAALHIGVDIKLPQAYLPESGDRLVVYKRLAQATTSAEIDRLQSETEDRFGHLPQAARNLFDLGRLRLDAERAGIRRVDLTENRLQIRFGAKPPIEPAAIVELVSRENGSLTPTGMLVLPAPGPGEDRLGAVAAVLKRILERSAA